MAAFRLTSKGRPINEISYETERESILTLLNMQIPSSHQKKFDIQPGNYVSIKFTKKYKAKQVSKISFFACWTMRIEFLIGSLFD